MITLWNVLIYTVQLSKKETRKIYEDFSYSQFMKYLRTALNKIDFRQTIGSPYPKMPHIEMDLSMISASVAPARVMDKMMPKAIRQDVHTRS